VNKEPGIDEKFHFANSLQVIKLEKVKKSDDSRKSPISEKVNDTDFLLFL
jgi:hypothetical protein